MTAISATGFVGKTHGRFRDFYRIGKILGTGGFGEVRVCVHRETGTQRAVKVLKKDDIDEERKIELFNEISILRKLVSILIFFVGVLIIFLLFVRTIQT